jgi:hypothetical protein
MKEHRSETTATSVRNLSLLLSMMMMMKIEHLIPTRQTTTAMTKTTHHRHHYMVVIAPTTFSLLVKGNVALNCRICTLLSSPALGDASDIFILANN